MKKYLEQDYFEDHRIITTEFNDLQYQWEIISVYTSEDTTWMVTLLNETQAFDDYLSDIMRKSRIDSKSEVNAGDQILTLASVLFLPHFLSAASANDASFINIEVKTDKDTYDEVDEITYSINIENLLDVQGNDIVITTSMPEGLEVVDTDSEIQGNTLVWELEELSALSEVSLQFTARVS
ncbi:hypothetical protein J2T56_001278 [Natronobacillus azotifigens]|uniref:DUF11 domain-containing protein n=1 Tax=Natronobacillus azotifigens TaxID=472978 RepID=A0A9J6RBE9_9BACI|nr:hypothetical protein [Natronobacillus azotifigens]MCZ0703008.1 hypothetical protein [Natronobacillus azotifigens]